MTGDTLHLKVVTPTRVVAETPADEVTLPGALGMLGILPGHAPLLATVSIGELAYRSGGRTTRLAVRAGFVEVANNVVSVLVDGAERGEEIDIEQALADRAAAEAELRTAVDQAFERARAAYDLASARLAVAGWK